RPNAPDLVTGAHAFPSDTRRPGMVYGKVLRPSSYGAKLVSLDEQATRNIKDARVIRDGDFVGVIAPTSFAASAALEALAGTAKWEAAPHPSSSDLYRLLREHADVPPNPFRKIVDAAKPSLKQTYQAAYVQHAPMEPRAAVAEWKDGKLTVWTGTQNPFGHRSEMMRAFHLENDAVRVIVPDFGAGFGGKHTGEASVEAARLAKGAGKPV